MVTRGAQFSSIIDQDGAVILDKERGLLSTLNPTGAFIWEGLKCGEPIEAIIKRLAEQTGEEVSAIEPDVHAFIESLKKHGLWCD